MRRTEELLLAFFSGILIAFGIVELTREIKEQQARVNKHRDAIALERHWRQVGQYLRNAQEKDRDQQKAAA